MNPFIPDPGHEAYMAQYSPEEIAQMDAVNSHLEQWFIQAEYGVLSVLLMNNDQYDRVAPFLRAEHFSTTIGQKVYAAIAHYVSKGQRCDVITVFEQLQRTDPENDISILELNDLAQNGGSVSMLMKYADSVCEKAKERDLVSTLAKAYEEAVNPATSVSDRTARISAMLDGVSQKSATGREPVKIGDLVTDYLNSLQRRADGEASSAIPTGIPTLDNLLGGGLKPGKVYVIAARPSVGKSAIAQACAEHCAKQGTAAALFSQEMTNEEMLERAISRQGGVSMGFHGKPEQHSDQFSLAYEASELLRNLPLFLFDQAGLRLQEIASRARQLKRKHGLGMLAIDYLQLCQSTNPRLSRHHQIEEISRGVKVLAKELNIPILLLSQLNREVDKRTPPRPIMSDLKESGAIEEDADVIIGMWTHEAGDYSSLIGFDVMKNRGGGKGSFGVRFTGKFQQWATNSEQLHAPSKLNNAGDKYDF